MTIISSCVFSDQGTSQTARTSNSSRISAAAKIKDTPSRITIKPPNVASILEIIREMTPAIESNFTREWGSDWRKKKFAHVKINKP